MTKRDKAEQIVRDTAKILVVGSPAAFTGVTLDALDPKKTYILAIMETV